MCAAIAHPAAHILLRDHQGVFVADAAERDAGLVTATGRWRYREGAHGDDSYRFGPTRTFSWPAHRLREVRWLDGDTE